MRRVSIALLCTLVFLNASFADKKEKDCDRELFNYDMGFPIPPPEFIPMGYFVSFENDRELQIAIAQYNGEVVGTFREVPQSKGLIEKGKVDLKGGRLEFKIRFFQSIDQASPGKDVVGSFKGTYASKKLMGTLTVVAPYLSDTLQMEDIKSELSSKYDWSNWKHVTTKDFQFAGAGSLTSRVREFWSEYLQFKFLDDCIKKNKQK